MTSPARRRSGLLARATSGNRSPRTGAVALALAAALGVLGGLGSFTFGYGKGWAYLSNDPAACANCHVMQEHHDSWQASGHEHVAVCNDCHLPPGLPGKVLTKADNGFFHSLAFTFDDYPDPIQIKQRNRLVTQSACIHCHSAIVHQMLPAEPGGDTLMCVHCHSDVGHAHKARSGRGNDRFEEP